jgi:hypothetical protein
MLDGQRVGEPNFDMMGRYTLTNEVNNNRPVYRRQMFVLYHCVDGFWYVGRQLGMSGGGAQCGDTCDTPADIKSVWQIVDNRKHGHLEWVDVPHIHTRPAHSACYANHQQPEKLKQPPTQPSTGPAACTSHPVDVCLYTSAEFASLTPAARATAIKSLSLAELALLIDPKGQTAEPTASSAPLPSKPAVAAKPGPAEAVVRGLVNQTDLNGAIVLVRSFDFSKGRYSVQVEGKRKLVSLAPKNTQFGVGAKVKVGDTPSWDNRTAVVVKVEEGLGGAKKEEGSTQDWSYVVAMTKDGVVLEAPQLNFQRLNVLLDVQIASRSYDWSTHVYTDTQYAGQQEDHLTCGISIHGFSEVLRIVNWVDFDVAQRQKPLFYDQSKNLSWNQGPPNGYDLCEIVIPTYLEQIGLPQLSIVEAILEGSIAELRALQKEVGKCDAFFSHVQSLPLKTTLQSLREGEAAYQNELREDAPATRQLRKMRFQQFLTSVGGALSVDIDTFFDQTIEASGGNFNQLEQHLKQMSRDPWARNQVPDFASIRTQKPASIPTKYFIDYLCLRQGLGRLITQGNVNSFDLAKVSESIKKTGTTLAEIGGNSSGLGKVDAVAKNSISDLAEGSSYLRRTFCVFEVFETVRARAKLLVCGPAVNDSEAALELVELATDRKRCNEVMDSSKAQCRHKKSKQLIDEFIQDSVGFHKLDKIVLSAIVAGCLRSPEVAKWSKKTRNMRGMAKMLGELAAMLHGVQDDKAALDLAQQALHLQESTDGVDSLATAELLIQVGRYMVTASIAATPEEQLAFQYRARSILGRTHGKDHISTAPT